MKADVLVAEIGSTTTLINAFCGIRSGEPKFIGQGQAPTSVLEGDVRIVNPPEVCEAFEKQIHKFID